MVFALRNVSYSDAHLAMNPTMAEPEMTTAMDVEQAAIDWFVRLRDPDLDAAEREAFSDWKHTPAHAEAYERIAAMWSQMDDLSGSFATQAPTAGRRSRGRRGAMRSIPGRRWAPAAAAAMALLAVGVGGGWLALPPGGPATWTADARSPVGETRTINLADGSSVTLNSGAALSERFDGTTRRVVLHRGQAFFDVARDPGRPFIVEAGAGQVQVLGTAFDVRLRETGGAVEVARGRVAVSGGLGAAVQLVAGGAAGFEDAAAQIAPSVAVEDVGAWREGRLVFQSARLADVLEDLSQYRRGRIVLMDRGLADRRVTGAFHTDRGEDALGVMSRTLELRLVRVTPLLTLVYAAE